MSLYSFKKAPEHGGFIEGRRPGGGGGGTYYNGTKSIRTDTWSHINLINVIESD